MPFLHLSAKKLRISWKRFERRIRPGNLNRRQEQYWDILMFLVRLLILSIPLYLILSFPGALYFAQLITATLTSFLLNALGIFTLQEGGMLTIVDPNQPFRFIISEDCTGWKAIIFLFALIFAVKGPQLKYRLQGLGLGMLVILTANMFRILGTVFVERTWGMTTALLVHDWLFRMGLVTLVIALWVSWIFLKKKRKNKI